MSFEALLSYVLEEVALEGEYGTTIPQLFTYVKCFYNEHRQKRSPIHQLCESVDLDDFGKDTVNGTNPSSPVSELEFLPTQALNQGLREEIWNRLCLESEFCVGPNNEGKGLTLGDVEGAYKTEEEEKAAAKKERGKKEEREREQNNGREKENMRAKGKEKGKGKASDKSAIEAVTVPTPANNNEETQEPAQDELNPEVGIEVDAGTANPDQQPTVVPKPRKWKVYTTVERRWQALTGHGVDPKKIPPKHFELLAEIGRHREKGIIQPELTKRTSQDARSVGPRTNDLCKSGYIEKTNVLAAKLRTSKLTLKAYATRRDFKAKMSMKIAEKGTKAEKEKQQNAPWIGETIDVKLMVEAIFRELRKAKNQVLMHSDLKKKLGMDQDKFHFRAFSRIIRRIERTGCLRRIRVPLKLHRKIRRKRVNGQEDEFKDKCLARCIKFIREPGEADWDQTLNLILRRDYSEDNDDEEPAERDDDDEKDLDNEDEQVDDEAVAGLENVGPELVEEAARILPKWTPGRPLENVIFEVVDNAGIDGVSSMDLHLTVAGRFYYRPLDQILRRLGDKPFVSQPSHLLRFAIIRETDIVGRHTHYRYFSYRWHEQLVAAGLGTPIGSVQITKKPKGQKTLGDLQKPVEKIDDLGFSIVDRKRLQNKDGTSTLQEVQLKTHTENEKVLKSKYKVIVDKEGKGVIDWVTPRREDGTAPKPRPKKGDGPPRPRGRPRKAPPQQTTPQGKRKLDIGPDTEEPAPKRPRGRPRIPDNKLKVPRKEIPYYIPLSQRPDPAGPETAPTNVESGISKESTRTRAQRARRAPGPINNDNLQTPLEGAEPKVHEVGEATLAEPVRGEHSSARKPPNEKPQHSELVAPSESVEMRSLADDIIQLEPEEVEQPAIVPKRRGRPPKKKTAAKSAAAKRMAGTPKNSSAVASHLLSVPAPKPSLEELPDAVGEVQLQTPMRVTTDSDKRDGPPSIEESSCSITELGKDNDGDIEMTNNVNGSLEEVVKEAGSNIIDVQTTSGIHVLDPSPELNAAEDCWPMKDTPPVPIQTRRKRTAAALEERATEPARRRSRRHTAFPASVEAIAEDIAVPSTPSPVEPPPTSRLAGSLASPAKNNEPLGAIQVSPIPTRAGSVATEISDALTPTPRTTPLLTPHKIQKGRMYKMNPPSAKQRLPRTEPTMELEEVDDSVKLSYGSAGGMLMIARQRVILELLEENGGVFPGGLEIKHAFECRYKRKNPKAGQPDRRLMVSLISSLQRSGRINQIVIHFVNSRGLRQTKRILADSKIPLDSPLILDMKQKIVAADGNLWFPDGTEIPKEAQRFANVIRGLPTQPAEIEKVDFDRMYVPTTILRREEKAMLFRQKQQEYAKQAATPRFTEEQRKIAAERLKAKKREASRAQYHALAESLNAGKNFQTPSSSSQLNLTEDNGVRAIWWNDFVHKPGQQVNGWVSSFVAAPQIGQKGVFRHEPDAIPNPSAAKDFEAGVQQVEMWEHKQLQKADHLQYYKGFNMVNHFGSDVTADTRDPEADFIQEKPDLDNIVRGYNHNLILRQEIMMQKIPKSILGRAGRRNPYTRRPVLVDISSLSTERSPAPAPAASVAPTPTPKAKPRVLGGRKPKRREQAMAQIYRGQKPEEELILKEVPTRGPLIQRKRHDFDKNDDDRLLISIVIVRTLFGGWDRRIDWNLVITAFPRYDLVTLKARWPRVRDSHKTHIKKLQADFESLYLEAYDRGEMPPIARGIPSTFDLPWHVNWFSENLDVPDVKSVPDLPLSRETFDLLYDIRVDKPSWREEYHSATLTMGNRRNYTVCHPYEVPLLPPSPPKEDYPLECVKSVIKANILTDISTYDSAKAFSLLQSYAPDLVNGAFLTLTANKTLAPKKDVTRITPGRNYEFTDKFHNALNKVAMDPVLFQQANAYVEELHKAFPKEQEKDGVYEGLELELSPLINDGSMLTLLDYLAAQPRRISLHKRNYISNAAGLVPGYRTRGMEKALVEFNIIVKPTRTFFLSDRQGGGERVPSLSTTARLLPSPPPNTIPRFRLWYDINNALVKGMWRKVVAAVLYILVGRPGIKPGDVAGVLYPAVEREEVACVMEWLRREGWAESEIDKREGREEVEGEREMGYWIKEGFYRALD